MLVETGSEQGGIEHDEKEMIHGVIELAETKVHEVMVPRIGIRAVDVNDPIDEVLDLIVRAGHSRLPVYEENLDNIIGILYAKDLLPYLNANGSRLKEIDLRKLVRPAGLRAGDEGGRRAAARDAGHQAAHGDRGRRVRRHRRPDHHGGRGRGDRRRDPGRVRPRGVAGRAARATMASSASGWTGKVSMDDLRDLFGLPDDEEEDEEAYDTVGGFIVHRVGRIPLPGATVKFRDVTLTVDAAEPRRVAKVIASRPTPPEEPQNGEGASES